MTKISYEERINLYYDRKNGMSFISLKSKHGINKSGVEYLVRLIDKHGCDILRTNENKSYSSKEKERLETFCKFKGYTIVDYYTDAGISAKAGNYRPEFDRLKEDIKRKKVNTIVSLKLDRITRSIFDWEK